MQFQEVVRRRRMIRRFEQRPIPPEVLRRVLETARHAPSAGFSQGFDFTVLETPEDVDWFTNLTDDPDDPEPFPGRDSGAAPAVIVLPFANRDAYLARYSLPDKIQFGMDRAENWPVPFWTVDTSMAILLILLAAVDEGLGAWYFGITHGEDELRRELGVPPSSDLVGVIALGYPDAGDQPRGSVFARRRREFDDMFRFGRRPSPPG
jgi:nitroreductase